MTASLAPLPTGVSIDIRDPTTAGDPVALVTRHLDTGARVTIHDPEGCVPTFELARRGAGVVVLDEAGTPLAAYADVHAAIRHSLTRWPTDLVAELERIADTLLDGAIACR